MATYYDILFIQDISMHLGLVFINWLYVFEKS
jgi:hypothetical protein